ncbi:MAG TPA: ABC transporter substrate-binding protein [Burkholderiaceae bacterium]|nr:ABC transporter substrate-binding protein [Burkholderiaceae bacterium]
MKLRHLIFVTSLALFATQFSWAENGVSKGSILIGQSITLQGGKNDYGMAVMAGIETYLNDVNSKGGVYGRQIVLKTMDDDNKSDKAEANARELINKEKAFLIFGSIEGGPSTAVMKVTNELKVPFFGPMAGSPTLRRPHQPLVFPVRAEHREEFRAMIKQAKSLGISKVAFLRSDSEVGQQHLANVKLICEELGMQFVLDMPFKSDVSDAQLTALTQQVEQSGAQMVLNHGSVGIYEKFIRKLHDKGGVHPAIYAVNSGSAQMAKHLGPLAQGIIFSQVVPSPWEKKTAVTREYQEAFKRIKPSQDFSYGSLEGYITAKALVLSLRQAGPNLTRESFVKGLSNASFDINDIKVVYKPNDHVGSSFVDLSIVNREGRFMH